MNCKKGDLAIIICDPHYDGKDIGKIVEVIRIDPSPCEDHLPEWECKCHSEMSGFKEGWENKPASGYVASIPDAWLRPLPDIQENENFSECKELKVTS